MKPEQAQAGYARKLAPLLRDVRPSESMKPRLYITIGVTTIMMVGVFIREWDPQELGVNLLLIPLCALSLLLICVWDVFGAIKLWPRYRLRSLAPLGVLVLAFVLTPTVGRIGFHLRVERFRKQMPEYERLAKVALRNNKRELDGLGLKYFEGYGQYRQIALPEGLRKLAWRMDVPKNPEDAVGTVVFVCVGGLIHDCYLYRSDGDISNTIRRLGYHLQMQITTNWCAVGY